MHKKSFLIPILIILNIVVIALFFFRYTSSTAPMVGGDFRYFIPRLLDNYLYQRINGIFSVHWYTPSFAGGEPVYANPQDIQYSLSQLLVWIFNPWQALRLSMVFFVAAGFIAFYVFFKNLLELSPFASILGAVFSTVNGFYIGHMVAGHVTFQVFPIFGVVLIILFNSKIPHWLGGILLSLLCSLFLYSGSFQVISYYVLTTVIILPTIYLLKPTLIKGKHMLATFLWGVGFSVLANGSKLWAIFSLMEFSPRTASDQYIATWLQGFERIVSQLVGSMTAIPLRAWIEGISYKDAADGFANSLMRISGSPYTFAGLDISLSPALLILLVGGLISLFASRTKLKAFIEKKRLIAAACLGLATFFVIEFTLARGQPYLFLHQLPIMSSLRANVRYTCAFIFPLAMLGAAIFNTWTKNWRSHLRVLAVFILFDGIALTSVWIYYRIPPEYQQRIFDIRLVEQVYPEIRYQNETFLVDKVVPDANTWEVFELHATNLIDPYEPLFKSFEEHFKATLHAGSVHDIEGGYFNIINPTGYVYPEANNTKPYDRISISDEANFLAFINRRPTSWKLPVIQQVLNWVAMVTIIAEVGVLLVYLVKKVFGSSKIRGRWR